MQKWSSEVDRALFRFPTTRRRRATPPSPLLRERSETPAGRAERFSPVGRHGNGARRQGTSAKGRRIVSGRERRGKRGQFAALREKGKHATDATYDDDDDDNDDDDDDVV